MQAIYTIAMLAFSEGSKAGNPLAINPGVIVWTTVTFLLLLFVLKKSAWKPILSSLSQREKLIRDSLEEAEKARQETEKMIAENKVSMAKAEGEAQKIIAQGREYAENLKAQILEASKIEAKKLLDDAKAEIQRKNQEAFLQLKEQVADIAVDAAEKIIKENLDREKQIKLVNKHLNELSKN